MKELDFFTCACCNKPWAVASDAALGRRFLGGDPMDRANYTVAALICHECVQRIEGKSDEPAHERVAL